MTLGDRVCVLRDGLLQQVDTPQNLFDKPVNLFVAGFMGSPAMNFVTAELVARRRRRTCAFAEHRAAHPRSRPSRASPAWTQYFGREIILGIRPSDFEDADFAGATRGWARIT